MQRSALEIEALLRGRGLTLTPQRRAIVRLLAEHGGHWSAAELVDRVEGASRATVYGTLALLRELGVVAAVATPGGELRFDADPEPHQHLACVRCGRLEDVPLSWLPVAPRPDLATSFAIERFRVVAEGICAACRQQG
jgi:Fur family peroxide stress response transcriptional regulator